MDVDSKSGESMSFINLREAGAKAQNSRNQSQTSSDRDFWMFSISLDLNLRSFMSTAASRGLQLS